MNKVLNIEGSGMLPIYKLEISPNIDNEMEVDFVALVDRPAIEKSFLAFNENTERIAFAIQSEDEKIITGALMLADKPIYRNDENGEYYVVFTKDTIKQIAQKFFAKGYQSNVNLMHDSGQKLEGLTMFESWITDEKRGISAMKGFEDVPDGSWFGSFKVNNDEVWKMIKDGKVKGFSVEGLFQYKPTEKQDMSTIENQLWSQITDILSQIDFGGPGSGRRPEGGNKDEKTGIRTGKVNYADKNVVKNNVDNILAQPPNFGTQEIYMDKNTGKYNSDRSEFHNQVIGNYYNDKGNFVKSNNNETNTSYFMGGAPATGKSSILGSGGVELPNGALIVDTDRIKGQIPEYNEMISRGEKQAAARVHEESSSLSKFITATAAKNGTSIVNDGVGDGKYESLAAKVAEQRAAGKSVVANYVTTDVDVSLSRAAARAERSGREVPTEYIKSMHTEISKIVPRAAKEGLFDKMRLYDNNGTKPKLIMEQVGKKITVYDNTAYNKFLAKAKG